MNILAIVLIVSGAMFGLCALCVAIGFKSDPKVFKISLIVTLICVALLIIGIVISLVGNSNKQKNLEVELEAALVVELEQAVNEFKEENPNDILKYEMTIEEFDDHDAEVRVVYKIETKKKPEIIGDIKFYSSHNYYTLFPHCFLESVGIMADVYGEVYVNGELRYTEKEYVYTEKPTSYFDDEGFSEWWGENVDT